MDGPFDVAQPSNGSDEIPFTLLCRVCGQTHENLVPIFEGEGSENNLAEKIHSYLPIKVDIEDGLPLQLCYQCASALLAWHNFIQNCIDTNIALNSRLSKSQPSDTSTKVTECSDSTLDVSDSSKKRSPHYRLSYHLLRQTKNILREKSVLEESVKDSDDYTPSSSSKNVKEEYKITLPVKDTIAIDNSYKNRIRVELKENLCINNDKASISTPKIVRHEEHVEKQYQHPQFLTHDANNGIENRIKNETKNITFKLDENNKILNMAFQLLQKCDCIFNERNETIAEKNVISVDHITKLFFKDLCKMLRNFKIHFIAYCNFSIKIDPEVVINNVNYDCYEMEDHIQDTCDAEDVHANVDKDKNLFNEEKKYDVISEELSESIKKAKVVINDNVFYSCPVCRKNLRSANTYIFHLRIHSGEKPWVCHLCGKQFRINPGLQRHLKETHQRIKNHTCELCGQKFVNRQNLIQHERIHTGERPFVCSICGKRFKQSGSLYIHNKTHTDNYPFQCSTCDAKFRSKAQLTHHIYKHTGEKPNVCQICGHAFRVKHDLNIHKLVHTDEKPFSCTDCGMAFRRKRYLQNHLKKNHTICEKTETII